MKSELKILSLPFICFSIAMLISLPLYAVFPCEGADTCGVEVWTIGGTPGTLCCTSMIPQTTEGEGFNVVPGTCGTIGSITIDGVETCMGSGGNCSTGLPSPSICSW